MSLWGLHNLASGSAGILLSVHNNARLVHLLAAVYVLCSDHEIQNTGWQSFKWWKIGFCYHYHALYVIHIANSVPQQLYGWGTAETVAEHIKALVHVCSFM